MKTKVPLKATHGKIIVLNEERGEKTSVGGIVMVGSQINDTIAVAVGPENPEIGLRTIVKVGDRVLINEPSLKHAQEYKGYKIFDFRDITAVIDE